MRALRKEQFSVVSAKTKVIRIDQRKLPKQISKQQQQKGRERDRITIKECMQPAPSAGKYLAGAKHGKIITRCQARQNIHPVPGAGKYSPGAKLVWSSKHATSAKHEKTHATGAKCVVCNDARKPNPNWFWHIPHWMKPISLFALNVCFRIHDKDQETQQE